MSLLSFAERGVVLLGALLGDGRQADNIHIEIIFINNQGTLQLDTDRQIGRYDHNMVEELNGNRYVQ